MKFSALFIFSCLSVPSLANKKYLILSFPDETSIAQKMLAVVSSIVYANLTDRTLILPHKLPFYSNPNTYDQLFNATIKLIDPLDTFRHFACPNVTTNSASWWVDDITYLTTNDYFLPALYLNREYRNKLEQWFPEYNPFKTVFEQHFKFDPLLITLVEDRYKQVAKYYNEIKNITGIVLEDVGSYYTDAKIALKCLGDPSSSGGNIIHAITMLPQYHHFLQEHFPRLLLFQEKTKLQNDLIILSEILFQTKYTSKLVLYPSSPISHIIHALSPKIPSIYLKNAMGGECIEANSHPEPCYQHSLKQYFQLCGERIGVDFNPHDPIARPLFIDTCKDAKIGIKIVLPIDDHTHQ